MQRMVMHPYHCVLCGTQLHEVGLGILECAKCGTGFIPTCNSEETELSVSWVHNAKLRDAGESGVEQH